MEESRYNWFMGSIKDISFQTSLLFTAERRLPRESVLCAPSYYDYAPYTTGDFCMDTPLELDFGYDGLPEQVLKSVFGYDCFRPLQREVIQNVLDGRDTLAVMPTGGGKSLCYQIPALIRGGLTVVISPLIALMQDQVSQLEAAGVQAAYLNSSLDRSAYNTICESVKKARVKLLYVSPEGLTSSRVQEVLHSEGVDVQCITVDEAHCISEWGHDFRPDYMEIASVREQFPHAVCLALTATATKQVQTDIVKNLRMEEPSICVASFDRPNVFLEVRRKNNALFQVVDFIKAHSGQCGIVYCFSRKQVDELCQALKEKGISAESYHAGLTDDERFLHQSRFIKGEIDVMVATVAFGMGINKPDVRFVVHYDLPKSIEQYYQEVGRAGRDGLSSSALLLYSPFDAQKIRYFFKAADDPEKAERLLQGMISYAEAKTCKRHFLLSYFGERYNPVGEQAVPSEQCCSVCAQNGTVKKSIYADIGNARSERPQPSALVKKAKAKRVGQKSALHTQLSGEEAYLMKSLKTWRKRTAEEMNVPPYVIFGDRTLLDIVSKRPQTMAALQECFGLGAVKVRRFGEDIVRIVKNN